jgi:SOS-response transcriptional repressor LexA
MAPIIQDGYVIAVDYSQNDHTLLNGKIMIAWNRDKGLTISRFKRYDHTKVLEPENRGYESITLSTKNRWKIIGKVLWWIGKAA